MDMRVDYDEGCISEWLVGIEVGISCGVHHQPDELLPDLHELDDG